MPRKSSNQLSKTSDANDKFQSNIKKWIDITQQIINLEKQLEKLREDQMTISHDCVNLTSNLSQEIKINSLVSPSGLKGVPQDVSKNKESSNIETNVEAPIQNQEPKKPVRVESGEQKLKLKRTAKKHRLQN